MVAMGQNEIANEYVHHGPTVATQLIWKIF